MAAAKPRCAILAGDFATAIIEVMMAEASAEADASGCDVVETIRVSGAYEIPLLAEVLLRRTDIDFLVALGFIERGETHHGEVMGHVVQQVLVDLQLKHRKPVGIGIIGPGATPEQAEKRKVDYARAAVQAAVRSWQTLRNLEPF